MAYYARVKETIVQDIIVLDDPTLLPLFSEGFDYAVAVEIEPGGVQLGWIFDNVSGQFTPPPET